MEEENNVETKQATLFEVNSFSLYLILGLFVAMTLIGVWVGYILPSQKVMEREVEVQKLVEVPVYVHENNMNLRTYQDSELGFAFEYPADWGKVSVGNESGNCPSGYVTDDCNFRTLLLRDVYSAGLFLSAETKGHRDYPIGRGAFWGDHAGAISSDYLSRCETSEKCQVFINDNGVYFALYEANPPPEEMGYQPERYYIYNPNSQYYGVILSSHRLNSPLIDNSKLFRETIIDSFRFIE